MKKNRMKITKKKRTKKGGNVLASGGFGCIFKPALKCKTLKSRNSSTVSKLMKKRYAAKEYGEVVKYLPQLKTIPNYQNYFLIEGFSTCDPEPLDQEDLENFDKKCKALTKNGFTKENVNKNLGKLKILDMPYGGIDIGDFIDSKYLDYKKLHGLNKSLQLLLKNGIIPMNKKGIYHCDIKESNVLVEPTEDILFTRLIDWGLSTSFNKEKKIPNVLLNRPFQFNVPFSNVLFNHLFIKMYNEFLDKTPNPTFIETRSFVINYTIAWVDERGLGHLRTLNAMFKEMFDKTLTNVDEKFKDDIIEYSYTFYFIFEYLTQILLKFTKDQTFQQMEYFEQVFLKNIDIWGFVMTYIPIFEYLYKNYKILTPNEMEILSTIKSMILFVMESSAEPIDVEKLESMLQKLDIQFEKVTKQKINFARLKTPSSSSSSSKTKKISTQKGGSIIDHYYDKKKSSFTSKDSFKLKDSFS